jgi:glycosyltransferase involved in cell wall biosynthesis
LKILQIANYISSDSRAGGPSTVALTNHREFINKGLRSALISLSNESFQLEPGVFLAKAQRYLRSNDLGGLWSFEFAKLAFREIWRADVVHIHFGRDLVSLSSTLMCIILRKNFYLQPHGMLHNQTSARNVVIDKLLVKRLTKKARGVFVLSQGEKDSLNKGRFVGENRLISAVNGVQILDSSSVLTRNRVLFVGRIHEIKQPLLFAEIAEILAPEFPGFRFEIYGPDGGLLEDLVEAISGSNTVHYMGAASNQEILDLFQETKVLVMTSLEEVFPMVVVEATTRGAAVLVMNNFGIAEMVKKEKLGAVSGRDKMKIVNALRTLLLDEIDHSQIATRASKVFDICNVTSDFIEEYKAQALHKKNRLG